ncbi:FREM2 (predicted) [Pycnogonum litorale]
MVERVQSLGNSFGMMIEKCFLCTGVDGYVPKYNPANRDFGCVAKSPNLLYAFKIIDKTSPDSVVKNFRGIPFNAVLAVDDPQDDTHLLLNQPGSDGFHLDSDALFKVSYGRQWFIHCIYIIRSQENSEKHIIKRSTTVKHQYYHAINSLGDYKRQRRAVDDSSGIGDEGKGTNIHQITLEYGRDQKDDPGLLYEIGSTSNDETALTPLWPILVGIILSILVIISVIIISFVLKRRRKDNHLRHPTPLPTRKTYGNGARNGNSRRVVIARDYQPVCSEHTEV